MERREYTRIACHVDAVLHLPGEARQHGLVRDISFGGAYLECDRQEACQSGDGPSSTCTLEMRITDTPQPTRARIRCQVVEVAPRRVGLRFTGADAGDYEHLRRFLLHGAEDPAALLEEMQVFPNPAFSDEFHLPGFSHWLKRMLERLKQRDATA